MRHCDGNWRGVRGGKNASSDALMDEGSQNPAFVGVDVLQTAGEEESRKQEAGCRLQSA